MQRDPGDECGCKACGDGRRASETMDWESPEFGPQVRKAFPRTPAVQPEEGRR